MKASIKELPPFLNINTLQNKKTGVWIATVTDLDIHTEADSFDELIFQVNDLVRVYFDIPKEIQFWYSPPQLEDNDNQLEKLMRFNILINPHASKVYLGH